MKQSARTKKSQAERMMPLPGVERAKQWKEDLENLIYNGASIEAVRESIKQGDVNVHLLGLRESPLLHAADCRRWDIVWLLKDEYQLAPNRLSEELFELLDTAIEQKREKEFSILWEEFAKRRPEGAAPVGQYAQLVDRCVLKGEEKFLKKIFENTTAHYKKVVLSSYKTIIGSKHVNVCKRSECLKVLLENGLSVIEPLGMFRRTLVESSIVCDSVESLRVIKNHGMPYRRSDIDKWVELCIREKAPNCLEELLSVWSREPHIEIEESVGNKNKNASAKKGAGSVAPVSVPELIKNIKRLAQSQEDKDSLDECLAIYEKDKLSVLVNSAQKGSGSTEADVSAVASTRKKAPGAGKRI